MWVVNETFNTIYVFSNDGSKLLKTLGEKNVPGADGTHFGKPQDVAFLPDGRILVADGLDNHRVMILDKETNYISEFGGAGKGPGQFSGVHALGVGPEGRIFALDRSGGRIACSAPRRSKVDYVTAFPASAAARYPRQRDSVWMTDLKPLRFVSSTSRAKSRGWCRPTCRTATSRSTFSVRKETASGDNQYGRTRVRAEGRRGSETDPRALGSYSR